jgi:hypothetical protein
MLLLLENDNLINFTFFFSGLLLGGLISKSVYSFDNNNENNVSEINKNNQIMDSLYKMDKPFYNERSVVKLENDNKKLLKLYRTLKMENTELNERLSLLNITNKSKFIRLENENKLLTKYANSIRNNGIFGINTSISPRLNNDMNYFGYNYQMKNNIIIIGNNVVVKQSSFEI